MKPTISRLSFRLSAGFLFNYLWLSGELLLIGILLEDIGVFAENSYVHLWAYGIFAVIYYFMSWSSETTFQTWLMLVFVFIQSALGSDSWNLLSMMLPLTMLLAGVIRCHFFKLDITGNSLSTWFGSFNVKEIDVERLQEIHFTQTWAGRQLNFGSIYLPIVGKKRLHMISGFPNVATMIQTIHQQIKNYETHQEH